METMWALSFPAFVCLLVGLALAESLWRWFTGLGLVPWLRKRTGRSLSTTAFDEFTTVVSGMKAKELEQRQTELMLRDDESDGAPPRSSIDLDGGTAFIVLPGTEQSARAVQTPTPRPARAVDSTGSNTSGTSGRSGSGEHGRDDERVLGQGSGDRTGKPG